MKPQKQAQIPDQLAKSLPPSRPSLLLLSPYSVKRLLCLQVNVLGFAPKDGLLLPASEPPLLRSSLWSLPSFLRSAVGSHPLLGLLLLAAGEGWRTLHAGALPRASRGRGGSRPTNRVLR